MTQTTIDSVELETRLLEAFASRGQAPTAAARIAAAAIVEAERVGMPEFGVSLALGALAVADIRWDGQIPQTEHGTAIVLDATGLFAPIVFAEAALIASARADAAGIGIVAVTAPGSLGRIAPYARVIANAGFVGLVTVGSPPLVAPHGGTAAALGTNPIAAAIPTTGAPIVVDASSSLLTKGRWSQLRERGEQVPEGAAIAADGQPTREAERVGAFLPRGGAFGTAMGVVVEMVTNGLTGSLGSARDRRSASVIALRSLGLDAQLAEVGDDLKQRLTDAGGYVPGSNAPAAPGVVELDAELLRRLEQIAPARS